jgi:hypothetical protein
MTFRPELIDELLKDYRNPSGQTFGISQRFSSTDSISKPQTELTTLFSLAAAVCQTVVGSPD